MVTLALHYAHRKKRRRERDFRRNRSPPSNSPPHGSPPSQTQPRGAQPRVILIQPKPELAPNGDAHNVPADRAKKPNLPQNQLVELIQGERRSELPQNQLIELEEGLQVIECEPGTTTAKKVAEMIGDNGAKEVEGKVPTPEML